MEKYYKISESSLRELIGKSLRLTALDIGGVDYWPGFDISNETYYNTMFELHRPVLEKKFDTVEDMEFDDWVDFFVEDYEVCEN